MAYAEKTNVPVARSRAEIEKLLTKFKCTQFVIGTDNEQRRAMVQFKANNRLVRFIVQLPDPKDKRFTHDRRSAWKIKSQSAIDHAVDQAERQRWRALMLVIKAKLEAVESQISTFEEEFLAHIVLPNDQTVATVMTPIIARAYDSGQMPQRLLAAGD